MKSKAIIAIAMLLALNVAFAVNVPRRGSRNVKGEIAKADIVDDTFVKAPEVVVDATLKSDSLFKNSTIDAIAFSAGKTDDTLYTWLFKWGFSDSEPVTVVKRAIDSKTLKAIGDDVSFDTKMKSKIGPVGKPGIGFLGVPTLKDSGKKTADNLFFTVMPATATSGDDLIETQLTSNKDANIGFYAIDTLWHGDYFYVIYVRFDKKNEFEDGIFLQAVKGQDGSFMYDSPIQVASFKNPPGSTMALGGLNKASNADKFFVLWKDYDSRNVMQATLDLATGKVDDPVVVAHDNEFSTYVPAGIITSSDTYGTVVGREASRNRKSASYSLGVFYNGDFESPSELSFETPKGYAAPAIKSFDTKDGFTVIAQYSGENDAIFVMKSFSDDGSDLTDQKVIGHSRGSMIFFADASGAVWLGYSNFDATTGVVEKAYLGKLME